MAGARDGGGVDWPTVAAIAMVAGVVSTQLHEAGGHGGACLALGRRVVTWGAFYLDCDTSGAPPWVARVVAAAGSTVNLAVAALALAAFRVIPPARSRLRYAAWLTATLNGFEWAGYFAFSGVSGLGDWGASKDGVLYGLPGALVWRGVLAVGGGLLYWLWARRSSGELAAITGRDDAERRLARRLASCAYWSIGLVAVVIGLFNPVGLFILLMSAMASSFGGASGLLWGPRYIRPGPTAQPPFAMPRSWSWISAAVVVVLAEGLVLGRSLHF